ncbi:hypothetical protein DTO271D3_6157 [Paecilomyces variotii]|nr:hypothetical protein DTO271D3_6157 [Paecilomyces variotii]
MAATAEVVILPSSSPAPIFAQSPTPVSYSPERLFGLSPRDNSSPSMLSPTSLFRSSHSARAQSRRSREGFAGGDVRSQNPGTGSEDILIMSAAPEELKEKPKRRAKKGTQGKETTAVNLDQLSLETSTEGIRKPAEVKKGRKRDTSKKQEKGNKTLKGKVAKVGAGKLNNDSGKAMLPDQPVENASNSGFDWEKDGLQLEEATKRRLDWTPTKNSKDSTKTTAAELVGNIDTNGDDVGGSQASCRRSFGNLLSTYGFDGESRAPEDAVRNLGGEGPTKRRRIELVDSNVFTLPTFRRLDTTDASSGDSAAETAAQEITKKPRKKKMTTITAHATARYVPDYEGDSNTLSRYLVVDEYQPTTEKATSKQKTSKTKKSHGTKDKTQGFTVVHPEAAFKSLEDQELLFGTCSQLEREESPTFVREVQKAIRASEADIQTEEGYRPTQSTMSHASGATTVSRFTASRNLWSVAARDSSGSLVQAEVVDLVDSPDASKVSSEILHQGILPVGRQKSPPQDNTIGLQSSPVASTEKAGSRNDKSLSLQAANQGSYISQSEHRSDPELAQEVNEQAVTSPEMPQYTGFTDAELAKKIASYGFKPVKGRNKMIELLQKCWESRLPDSVKHAKQVTPVQSKELCGSERTTESCVAGNKSQARKPAKADSAGSQSKRTAGRKADRAAKPASKRPSKKITTSENQEKPKPRFQDVEEIEDSEEELIPSPSRMWRRYIPRDATPVPLPLSAVPSPAREQNNTKKPSRSYQLPEDFPELSTKVMEAIRAQPRRPSVNGRPCLTWHEKILMYDPIVPEDLTAWLNTEGLNLVGEDEEVSPHFVRKWCESHGICCCPKKT